jgi:hypothetical protein
MKRIHPVFPVAALKRYHRSGRYQPAPSPEFIDDEPEYEVDWIADTRGTGKRRQYKVYWVGWGDHFDWLPLRNLTNCPRKLAAFWEHRQKNLSTPHNKKHGASFVLKEGEM